ncbi:MAG: DNA methylase [Blautia sp.]|nr:DNA methylase [Blautia sp.]MCM1200657.1 DNA methylase [Bacteroides fragilis]
METNHIYIAIDLKSFYASVECVERQLNPMDTNLVVADSSRTEKTICLAVSPSLRAVGIPGRARLFEVIQKVREENARRKSKAPGRRFQGESCHTKELQEHPEYALSYIIAPPRMAYYMKYSTRIYEIYLKYIAPEDIHVYSIDEVFMDVTAYLKTYSLSARELAAKIIQDVFEQTGITAAAGIGTNLYLCKTAMDIGAKHVEPDKNGVRIAELDERKYRELLWDHQPITDFWRVGRGYAKKLAEHGMFTMGDVARCSVGDSQSYYNEDLLYRLFGVNAELLIDHAWGFEPTTIDLIKQYKPETNSISSGQVLHCPYAFSKAKLIVKEMTDLLVLDLVEKRLVTDQLTLTIGYDVENLTDPETRRKYKGEVTTDRYGRKVPKHAHGTTNLNRPSSSTEQIMNAVLELYERIADKNLLIRRITVAAGHLIEESDAHMDEQNAFVQMDLFTDYEALEKQKQAEEAKRRKERALQEAILSVKKKYGKNAILKGMNLEEGSTGAERNNQIGGHKA